VNSSDLAEVRRTLWAAADQLRANSTLAPHEYRGPVLGLIFLAHAEHRFEQVRAEVEAKATALRPVTPDDYPQAHEQLVDALFHDGYRALAAPECLAPRSPRPWSCRRP
jgi:type I restriction-modification system DNA methylase subunit